MPFGISTVVKGFIHIVWRHVNGIHVFVYPGIIGIHMFAYQGILLLVTCASSETVSETASLQTGLLISTRSGHCTLFEELHP